MSYYGRDFGQAGQGELRSAIVAKVRIHPFQYAMVGLALGVFFLILLALSELVPFVIAYSTAAAGTIGLVVTHMVPVLRTGIPEELPSEGREARRPGSAR